MAKYRIEWTETLYYSATVDADSTEDAVEALHGGEYEDKECTDSTFEQVTHVALIVD